MVKERRNIKQKSPVRIRQGLLSHICKCEEWKVNCSPISEELQERVAEDNHEKEIRKGDGGTEC